MSETQGSKKPGRWLTPGVLGIGFASLLSDWGHEAATAILPAFLASLGAPAGRADEEDDRELADEGGPSAEQEVAADEGEPPVDEDRAAGADGAQPGRGAAEEAEVQVTNVCQPSQFVDLSEEYLTSVGLLGAVRRYRAGVLSR